MSFGGNGDAIVLHILERRLQDLPQPFPAQDPQDRLIIGAVFRRVCQQVQQHLLPGEKSSLPLGQQLPFPLGRPVQQMVHVAEMIIKRLPADVK